MTGLPKFVRDQMARTPAPASHPDADLLTAFAENALTLKERQQVVEHLSACADCREAVFLAQPEATQTVLAPKPRRFTWMAWASAAAVVVVVASAVILQHEQITKPPAPVTIATTTPPESKPTAPSAFGDEKAVASGTQPHAEEPRRESDLDAAKRTPATEPLLSKKDSAANEERAYLKTPVPTIVAPTADQQVTSGAAPQQAPTGPEQRNIAGQMQQAQGPSNSANANIAANENLAKAASVPKVAKKQSRSDAFHGLVTGYAVAPTATALPAARAHWQISPGGVLERSYVADNWAPVLTETGTKFHVVSVIGNTVWAGGEHGALYVSRDGGANWNPITLNTTATITSVHFSDDMHGTIQTADGQAWKTSDAGKTWQKQ